MRRKFAKKSIRALTALMLAIIFSLPQGAALYAATEQAEANAPAGIAAAFTRAQARDRILAAASHYRDGLKPTDIMSGYPDGSLKESRPVTRLEALVMISRAFGELPEPTGDFLRVSAGVSYSDAPAWAASYIDRLTAARVMFVVDEENEDGDRITAETLTLNGGEPMPAQELDYVLRNIYSLYGARPQDDFYAAVNKEWLAASEVPEDSIMDSYFDRLKNLTIQRESEIYEGVLSGEIGTDKTARAIRDYYASALDIDAQTKAGAEPIRPYLDKIMAAKDKKGLEDVIALISKELAVDVFFDFSLEPDEYDKTKYSMYIRPVSLGVFEQDPEDEDTKAKLKKNETLFTLAGFDKGAEYAMTILNAENWGAKLSAKIIEEQDAAREAAALAEDASKPKDESDVNLMFFTKDRPIPYSEIKTLFPGVDLEKLLAANGLKAEPTWYSPYGENSLRVWAEYYKQADIEDLKVFAAYKLIDYCVNMLGEDFHKLDLLYEPGWSSAQGVSRFYVEKLYIEKYFSAESKKDVENMAKTFIGNYRGRIENIAWMSAETKAMAIRKLDNMVVKVGYPDSLFDPIAEANIRSPKDGGTFFENLRLIRLAQRDNVSKKQGKPVDRMEWSDTVTEVNAFYRPTDNEILIPAAILQPPFYTPGAKQEQNMAAIGWVIGHEITHAFDNAGAKFDEYGNEEDWWTEADYAAFRGLCKAVIAYYDGYEIAPGILADGESTLGENIADLGGISCALEAVSALPNPDYKLFFESAAKLWICTMERETLYTQVDRDPHSSSKARANRVLATFKEFYETFGVKEGDGMYVPPEKRVKVW